MDDSVEKAKEYEERCARSERRQKLFQLLKLILDGKIDGSKTPLARIFNQDGPRQQYVSPKDRGDYNYGYMGLSDLVENPFLM
jgi:hypothetical protein